MPDQEPEVVDILISARGTWAEIWHALDLLVLYKHTEWSGLDCDGVSLGEGEADVLRVKPGVPRISNRAVLAAEASGLLAIHDPDRPADEEALRGEGDGVSGGL